MLKAVVVTNLGAAFGPTPILEVSAHSGIVVASFEGAQPILVDFNKREIHIGKGLMVEETFTNVTACREAGIFADFAIAVCS